MEKLKMHSPDFTDENIARVAELFPNCVTESVDENGNLKRAIDLDLLRQELSGSIVEGPQERYQLNWPGKREALLAANAPIAKTLRPCREESVDFDTTKNLYIEGDNLDALKLLQETYLGKVKMIYIDPPYNTGNDFIYNDDFAENKDEYFERSMQKDEDGNRLVANSESNGRFHSDWLSMMYPRLKLARNLLRDDGVIFISIDDNEQANLKRLCDEVFGDDNSTGNFVWEKKKKPSFLKKTMGNVTEYIVSYTRDYESVGPFIAGAGEEGKKYPFNNAGNTYSTLIFQPNSVTFSCSDQIIPAQDMSEGNIRSKLLEDVVVENGKNKNRIVLEGEWRYSQESVNQFIKDGDEIKISKVPFRPNYINRNDRVKKTANLLSHRINNIPTNEDATEEIRNLFDSDMMDYPKPTGLLLFLTKAITEENDIILDFFSGSATTAHAVMQLNAEDGGNRQFIMVQLPEETDEKSEAHKAGYKTIAEIGKERIRRAGKKIKEELERKAAEAAQPLLSDDGAPETPRSDLDIGFRVLKIDSSNMKEVYYSPDKTDQQSLLDQVSNIKEDRTAEDLVFQVMLDSGVDLSLPITREQWSPNTGQWSTSEPGAIATGSSSGTFTVFFIDENALACCFDEGITEDLVKELAKRQPLRVVFRDSGFASDDVKINTEQIFKQMSPATEVRSI